MERRVFVLLVLLILSVILNIFLATKVFKFKKIANAYNEYTSSMQNKFNEYERKANKVENKIEDRMRNINKNTVNK